MIELIGTLATIGAIIGVIANNRRLRWCFLIWFVTNAASLGIHVYVCVWSMAARDAVFMALAVDGWIRWGKKTEAAEAAKGK